MSDINFEKLSITVASILFYFFFSASSSSSPTPTFGILIYMLHLLHTCIRQIFFSFFFFLSGPVIFAFQFLRVPLRSPQVQDSFFNIVLANKPISFVIFFVIACFIFFFVLSVAFIFGPFEDFFLSVFITHIFFLALCSIWYNPYIHPYEIVPSFLPYLVLMLVLLLFKLYVVAFSCMVSSL